MSFSGFGFSGYRSFGNELVKIAPLNKINFIIGQNNVGKSNIIHFLASHYSSLVSKLRKKSVDTKLNEIDLHISEKRVIQRISFPMIDGEVDKFIVSKLPDGMNHITARMALKHLLSSKYFTDENGIIWFTYKFDGDRNNFPIDIDITTIQTILKESTWRELWNCLTRQNGGELLQHWIPQTIAAVTYIPEVIPKIEIIPAIRRIGNVGSSPNDYSGEGIIIRLAKIQNPPLPEQILKNKFSAINKFVQVVLENPTANIEIPFDRDMILVHMDGKTLPLSSLGTGVHEVIILAAASTILEDTVVCVEEPELHLHPKLQRKLIDYLSKETNNQYLFTTHSAHLIDAIEAQIFHITMKDGVSKSNSISNTIQRSNICKDLGYKASDILQSNCIIWVEGPSDRIYLNYWLNNKKPDLIEGIHYSIMFYGGRLLSHLSGLDKDELSDQIDEFILLKNLNRNSAIMFDSDQSSPEEPINTTKQRLKDEFNRKPGFAWVTSGREIENYLNPDKIEQSVIAVHPSASHIINKGIWSNLLKYINIENAEERTAEKVKVAKYYITQFEPEYTLSDLNEQIEKLCAFIIEANSDTN